MFQKIVGGESSEWKKVRMSLETFLPTIDQCLHLLDKKVQAGSKRWVMLEEIGRSVVRTDVPEELVEKTVRELVG